jgi:site-specific recombinase XerD
MPRASDSPTYRASDSPSVATWASDPAGPDAWASDPEGAVEDRWPAPTDRATDWNPDPATDPAAEWDGRAWGATDRIRSLPPAIGLGAALDAFCAGKAAEGLSPRSIIWYRMIGERLVGRFGAARPVDTLTATELRAWLVELRATLAPMSVAGYVRGLHAFGNWLASDGLAAARALRALARPRVPRKVIEPLSDADLRRLLSAAQERDRAVLLLLLDTGLRVSEVVGIRLGDLRPDGGIKVTGKGAAERIVPVGGTARRAVGAYLAARGPGALSERLFLNQADQALTTSGVSQLLRRLRGRTGVTARCNPHSFRHTFAHNYLVNGGDALSLQRILGHSSLEMVRRYVRLSDIDLAGRHRAASPADRLLARPAGHASSPPAALPRWSAANGGAGSGAHSRRSTGETLRWTARRSSSSRSR